LGDFLTTPTHHRVTSLHNRSNPTLLNYRWHLIKEYRLGAAPTCSISRLYTRTQNESKREFPKNVSELSHAHGNFAIAEPLTTTSIAQLQQS
jgi:hypothetical protein